MKFTLVTDKETCALYSHDDSRHQGLAEAVVFPQTHDEVVEIVRYCHDNNIPLTARGKGTGTPGGAVPVKGGWIISLEKMNKIIECNPADRYIKVQAGILNQTVQDKAAEAGFCWAPDPGSAANCTVGGNIAYNAAGPRAVKYGATRENVLGLTAVTGTGDTIHTGGYTSKSAVGYDLTRLLIGSEGTLGIVTEAILKLIPLPQKITSLQLNYPTIQSAALAAIKIMSQPYIPEALELLDTHAAKLIGIEAGAVLLVKTDHPESIENGVVNEGVWALRKTLSPALKTLSPHKINEDIVVPVSKIPELLNFLNTMAEKNNILIVTFGHAGNGNLHVNLLIPKDKIAEKLLGELFDKVIELKGTISGEHGIGLEKMPYIAKAIDENSLNIMRDIKKIFDPKGILNPGKIFYARENAPQ